MTCDDDDDELDRTKGEPGRWFQTTHWSLVARAGAATSEEQRQALGQLVERYSPSLRAHLIARKGLSPQDAEELLQAFLAAKIVEQALVAQAAPQRGRFRTFVLTALDRFVISHFRRRSAGKRFAGVTVAVDEELNAPASSAAPDEQFDIQWARDVLQESLRRMRAECERSGRRDVWGVFEARVVAPMLDDATAPAYDELVTRLGLTSPAQASNVLVTAKRMFVRSLRGVIGEYELGEEQIDAEIADLRSILARAK
jgi:RNA polymerase sigma-70 factor (ECF subfamily)